MTAAAVPRRALVRRPSPALADGLTTHISRRPVDVDLARAQWQRYVEALADAGWTAVEVAPADDCPDGVFVEDTVIVVDDLAVVAMPGAPQRRPETAGVEDVVRRAGLRVAHITEPATLDGGDVLRHHDTVWVGRSGRTNAEGVRQLRDLLAPLGITVIPVPVTRVLHLKSAVTALPDGTVIGYAPVVDDPKLFATFLPVPEESGSHVVVLGDDTVLMASSAPRTAALLRDRGLTVHAVDVSEFEKLEGCVTCLSVLLDA